MHYVNIARMRRSLGLIVAIAVALVGLTFLDGVRGVYAVVDAIGVTGVSADCKQATITLTDSGNSGTRTGYLQFLGSVSIPQIDVSCALGNCDSVNDVYTLNLNGGAGYASATPVSITFRAFKTSASGIFNTVAGFPLYDDTTVPGISPGNEGSITLPACGSSGGGGSTGGTTTTSLPALPPLDPPGTAPRVYGGYDNLGSEVVVYQQSFGYQFYSATGVPVGQVDLGAVGIPSAGGLIASMSNDGFRADLFYDGGDYLRVKFHIDGVLVEDGRFLAPGIGARAGEVAGGGYGGGSGGGSASGGTLQVLCPQRLRLEAATNSVVVDVLQPGDVLAVIGRSNDNTWFNVTTADNLTGWVFYGQCINVNSSSINNAPISVEFEGRPTIGEQQAAPSGGQGLVQVSAPPGTPVAGFSCGQNLRSGPGNDYFVIRVIPAGSSMIVTGRSNDLTWVQLSAGTLNGWATLGGCISPLQGDVSAAPVLVDLSN